MIKLEKSKLFIISGALVVVLLLVVWQIIWFTSWHDTDLIFQGIKVNGITISGYTRDDAESLLNKKLKQTLQEQKISLVYADIDKELIVSNFVKYDCYESVLKAYNIGRNGYVLSDYFSMLGAKLFGKNFIIERKIDRPALKEELQKLAPIFYTAPKDAELVSFDPNKPQGEKLTAIDEIVGQKIDIKKTLNSIETVLASGQQKCNVYIEEIAPSITKAALQSIDTRPVVSNQTFRNITVENKNSILQITNVGRHHVIYPGEELSVIDFLGVEDYIYFEMPDGGTGSDYDIALCEDIPTQIYQASVMAELDIVTRHCDNINKPKILPGTSTIISKYYDMILKNNLDFPVIVRIGYNEHEITSDLYCEVYRPQLKYPTFLRSAIHHQGDMTLVDIKRVYIDSNGEPINTVVVETLVR